MARFVLLGDPVSHSKSPLMHAAAYAALGLSHHYDAVRVEAAVGRGVSVDTHELQHYTSALRRGELGGINVTIPHKIAALQWVDEVDDSAEVVGAANTLVRTKDGKVRAYNTDAPALVRCLTALGYASDHAKRVALILGSGGAARAAIYAAAMLGAHVVEVRARSFSEASRAQTFQADMAQRLARRGYPVELSALPLGPCTSDPSLVIQATSLGMHAGDSSEALVSAASFGALARDAIAYDVVYTQAVTPFVAEARRAGLRAESGLAMLANQGALAFSYWLDVAPPFDVMARALQDAYGRGA